MKKILMLLLVFVFLISSVSAVDTFFKTHGISSNNTAGDTAMRGQIFRTTGAGNLTSVTKFTNSLASGVALYSPNGTNIANATYSGNNATFSTPIHLANQSYFILCQVAPTQSAWNNVASYPYNTIINITFIASQDCSAGFLNQTGEVREISGITMEYGGAIATITPSLTLNSPANLSNQITPTTFIITANSTNSSIQLTNVTLFLNGVLNETKSITGTGNITTFSKTIAVDKAHNWTAYVCDSYNCSLIAGNRTFFSLKAFDSGQDYSSSAIESSSQTFNLNLSLSSGYSISAINITYNNTNTIATFSSYNSTLYQATVTLTLPSVNADTNKTFNWTFLLSDGTTNTTLNKIQTVLDIKLDNCSNYTNMLVNYTLLDELTQAFINNSNSTIESLVILKTNSGLSIATFNQTFTGVTNSSVCSQSNITTSGLKLWEQSRYGSTNYVYEAHNIQNNSITSLPINIPLLDLLSTSATTFRITYKSITFLPVPDVVIDIQRKYIGDGIYRTIESPLTDANGQASASFDLNSVIYRILVKQNGTTLSTFENPAISCNNILTGDCQVNINERQSVDTINNFDDENDFHYGLTQDNRTISLTFSIPSGTLRNITMIVNQSTILGNDTTCVQTLLATSGRLDCTVSASLGDVFTSIYVYVDGQLLISTGSTILDDRSTYFGTDNIILTFFLVLSIVLLMISDPIAMLFGVVIGLVGSSLMLLLNSGTIFGSASVLMYIVIVIILIIVKISRRT